MLGSSGLNAGSVEVTFTTKYDGKGIKQLSSDLNKAEKATGGLTSDMKRLDRESGKVGKSTGKLGSSLKSGLKVGAATAATAIGAGLVIALKQSIVEAREAAKVTRQTEAVIKSTGGVANVTAKSLENLSTSISNKTAIDDEQIQSAGNLLLTFKNIRNEAGKGNDIFNQTTMATADLSVAMGQDFKSSAIQLGKALNDPIKGLSALRRVGIQFTVQQEEQIKKMVESGNIMGAQKMILKELNSQFGGSAAAAADPIQRLQIIFKNFLEDIGGKLLPFLNKMADGLAKFVNQMMTGKGAGGEFMKTLKSIAEIAKNLWPTIKAIGGAIFTLVKAFASLPAPVQVALASLGGLLILSIKLFGIIKVFTALKSAAMAFFTFLRIAPAMAGPVGLAIAAIAIAAFLIIKNWDKVKKFLGKAWTWIKQAAKDLADFVINAAKKGFLGPIPWIIGNWEKVVSFFKKLPSMIWGGIQKIGSIIIRPFVWAANKIKNIVDSIIGFFTKGINKIVGKITGITDKIGGIIGSVGGFLGFADGGVAQPGQMAFVGDSSKPEFVISQTGPRDKNIGILAMAAEALGIPGFAKGGVTKMKKAVYDKKMKAANKYRTGLDNQFNLLNERYQIEDRKARFDDIITAAEAGKLKGIIDQKINNLKKRRASFGLSAIERKQIDFQIQNLMLDKRDLNKEIASAAGAEAGASLAEQISAFNAERFAVLSSFGGNIRSRTGAMASMRPSAAGAGQSLSTSTTNAGKAITINQEFKERPEDPHVWTRNIQNEITALI